MLGIYILVTAIPILLVGFYLNYSMRDVVLKNAISEVDANVDKMEMRLHTTLDRAINISDLIYINKDLKKVIEQPYASNLDVYNAYKEYPIFDEYLKYYHEVENIRFFMTREMITDSHFIYADQTVREQDWFKRAIENQGRISWEYITDQWTNKQYLTLTRAVYGEKNKLLGVLNIYISPGILSSIFEKELFNVYISLDNQKIVHSNQKELIDMRPFFKQEESEHMENGSYIFDSEFRNEQVKIYLRSFQPKKTLANNIQITAIIPIQEVIKDSNTVLLKGYFIVILSIIVSVTLIYLFIKSFNRRIYTLRHAMYNVAQGNFEIKELDLGLDEIGQVYKDLDVTVDSIKQLINEVYIHQINEEQWKRRQKESEFRMLASQINPHFLYNTLEMIRMKALINKDEEVANIVRMLSDMMRSSLEVTDRPIPLKKELDLITNYLKIQRLRFGNKINFEFMIECDPDEYHIFPLLLQPLVENSVIHGIEEKLGESFINISITESKDNLVLQVIDNGVGISKQNLQTITKKLDQSDEKLRDTGSIGLYNVSERIKLYYGDDYGIDIESELGEGTTVTLYLPLKKGTEKYAEAINS